MWYHLLDAQQSTTFCTITPRVCVHVCGLVCVHVYACINEYEDQMCVFPKLSLSPLLRQSLLNMEFMNLTRLAGQWAPEICFSHPQALETHDATPWLFIGFWEATRLFTVMQQALCKLNHFPSPFIPRQSGKVPEHYLNVFLKPPLKVWAALCVLKAAFISDSTKLFQPLSSV